MDTPTVSGELESPPVTIAKGLGTYAGLAGAAAAVIPVVIAALTDARLDARTRALLIVVGGALLGLVILSRAAQAVAAELARGRSLPAPLEPLELEPATRVRARR